MDPDTKAGWFKVALAWLGVFLGGVTLNQVAVTMTIAFTIFQFYVGIRKMRRDDRMEKFEARLRHEDVFPDKNQDVL